MEATADGLRTGMRERRRLTSHLRDCADCRRTAVSVGLDDLALAAARDRGHALRRIAGLLPLPGFLRRKLEDGVTALYSVGPAAAEHGASLAGKATAVVVAAALAAGGAGVATKASGGGLSLPGVPGAGPGRLLRAPGRQRCRWRREAATGPARPRMAPARWAPARQPAGRAAAPVSRPAGEAAEVLLRMPGLRDFRDRAHRRERSGSSRRRRGRAVGGAERTPGSLGGTVGSVLESPGDAVQRTGDRVTGTVDQTLQDVTGGRAPRVPNVQLPGTNGGTPGTGGGSSSPSLPNVGGLGAQQPSVQVQTPSVTVPQTGVTVPSTRLSLP